MSESAFTKYSEQGDYHWVATQRRGVRGYDPRLHARYLIAADAIARHVEARAAVGVDIGCGDGVMLNELARRDITAAGVDLEATGLALARARLQALYGRAPYLAIASAYRVPLPAHRLDFVVSLEVVEHLEDVDAYLGEIRRLLKPEGIAVLTTPHQRPDARLQDPFHVREYNADTLRAALAPYFKRVQIQGLYPQAVDRWYVRPTRNAWINKAVRLVSKPLFRYVYNPYRHRVTAEPGFAWCGLIAVCRP